MRNRASRERRGDRYIRASGSLRASVTIAITVRPSFRRRRLCRQVDSSVAQVVRRFA